VNDDLCVTLKTYLKVDTARPSPEGAQLLSLFLYTIFKCRLSRLTSYDPVRAVLFRDVVPKVLVGMPHRP
jgi:hypothetical protein